MSKQTPNYDVFVSYSFADRSVAENVMRSLGEADLSVFDPASLHPGTPSAEAIWNALAISEALLAVMPMTGDPSPNTAAELGAALAWNKPVFLVRRENGHGQTPFFLTGVKVYPLSRIDDVANAIKRGQEPLSEDQQEKLHQVFKDIGAPTDRLLREPALLDQLAKNFRKKAGTEVSGERLMYEMLRLRKQRRWPRIGKSGSAKAAG